MSQPKQDEEPKEKIDPNRIIELNKKIAELKKKIQLAEGQQKAHTEEWETQKKTYTEKISELKKDIKDLTGKLEYVHNPSKKTAPKKKSAVPRKIQLPVGAKSAEQGVQILDLKIIDLKKQIDMISSRYQKRQEYFDKLVEEYQTLLSYKNNRSGNVVPPETLEEDSTRKQITHLENEIHRTSVQWMEAEHIRKKYRGIKASLMNDSEKFESSLLELEQAIMEQQAEINKLEAIHKEAMSMRDTTKYILQRQEMASNCSNRARDRQAIDFRRRVEDRKLELEKLERKIFSTGKQAVVHQDSVNSDSGEKADDPIAKTKDETSKMQDVFKKLMHATGVSSPNEIVDRFLAQKEALQRLNYLRTVTENEKKQLQSQREVMSAELDEFKFADTGESDVNQEELERLKKEIEDHIIRRDACTKSRDTTQTVIDTIRDALIELLLKLQEIDENVELAIKRKPPPVADLPDIISGTASNEQLVAALEEKIKLGMITAGQLANDIDSGMEEEVLSESAAKQEIIVTAAKDQPSEDKEKAPNYPPIYGNLITRTTGQMSSASPGQTTAAAMFVNSDDEGDVPSRVFIKRQAQQIVESKSRRKGLRMQLPKRR
ncbi:outer dynein arm-docking complex subunit 3 [Culicoides brevitarsis]|uniref:outer dynein arm-docking complex subunit 3 n=1 Tax=Culicoides brevitarsis TaxID=469753 RepID=UPI00307C5BEC